MVSNLKIIQDLKKEEVVVQVLHFSCHLIFCQLYGTGYLIVDVYINFHYSLDILIGIETECTIHDTTMLLQRFREE